MLVEEIPRNSLANPLTLYFSLLVNLAARPAKTTDENRGQKKRQKVNYNLTDLLNAQTQTNVTHNPGEFKTLQQVQLERLVDKRLTELGRETQSFDTRHFQYTSIHELLARRVGNTPLTKRILAARRNLNSYFEEEKNLISINTILGVNYAFVEQNGGVLQRRRRRRDRVFKPKVKLCHFCGQQSNYSRCRACGLFVCSVRCNLEHQRLCK